MNISKSRIFLSYFVITLAWLFFLHGESNNKNENILIESDLSREELCTEKNFAFLLNLYKKTPEDELSEFLEKCKGVKAGVFKRNDIFNEELGKFQGFRPLFYFIYKKDLQRAKFLLDYGVENEFKIIPPSILSTSIRYFTPLILAVYLNDADMVNLLIDYDTPLDTISHENVGITALTLATQNENQNIIEILLDHSADIDLPGIYNLIKKTPLMIAVEKGNLNLVKYFLERKCEVNKIEYYKTALDYAYALPEIHKNRRLLPGICG